MLSLSLSLSILLSALHLHAQADLLHQRARHLWLLEDQANQLLELIERVLQQAGYVDVTKPMSTLPTRPLQGAIDGIDDAMLSGNTPTGFTVANSVSLASDLLNLRLRGDASGVVVDCAGFAIPAASAPDDLSGRVVLYIGLDPLNEPELRCQFRGASQWTSQAIASGVLSLQIRFGIDTDSDNLPNYFLNATQLAAKADHQSGSEISLRTQIVAVHVALLMRSTQRLGTPKITQPFHLFGEFASSCSGDHEVDAKIQPTQLKSHRLYRQFDKVIFLKNSLRPDA